MNLERPGWKSSTKFKISSRFFSIELQKIRSTMKYDLLTILRQEESRSLNSLCSQGLLSNKLKNKTMQKVFDLSDVFSIARKHQESDWSIY